MLIQAVIPAVQLLQGHIPDLALIRRRIPLRVSGIARKGIIMDAHQLTAGGQLRHNDAGGKAAERRKFKGGHGVVRCHSPKTEMCVKTQASRPIGSRLAVIGRYFTEFEFSALRQDDFHAKLHRLKPCRRHAEELFSSKDVAVGLKDRLFIPLPGKEKGNVGIAFSDIFRLRPDGDAAITLLYCTSKGKILFCCDILRIQKHFIFLLYSPSSANVYFCRRCSPEFS